MAQVNADLSNYETIDFDFTAAIPPGDYEVEITGSQLKQSKTSVTGLDTGPGGCAAPQGCQAGPAGHPTSSGPGLANTSGGTAASPPAVAEFEFMVIGPYCRGARLWDRFTLNDDSSMRRLKTLAVAAGVRDPNFIRDTGDLHGLRCRVRVERLGERGAFGSKNLIVRYYESRGS